jgi:DNA repair photolyase
MGLNKSKGNMYDFVTHTWNTVKGACPHDCEYCYVKRIAKRFKKSQPPPYFDECELKTNLGSGNFIFVGSSNDLFADEIPDEWIIKTLHYCAQNRANRYLYQTKNPLRIAKMIWRNKIEYARWRDVFCVTIESNRDYPKFMGNAPKIEDRFDGMMWLDGIRHLTIEPIMDFDLDIFVDRIKRTHRGHLHEYVKQVNIGADSGRNHLPEPSAEKIMALISELEKFVVVNRKSNLKRILGNGN